MEGHRLGVLLWFCVCVMVSVAGTCPARQYGDMCSYQCHCPLTNCDPTSGCQPPHCSKGWSGPTCQKDNIALNKTTTSSDGYILPSSNAVNGYTRGDNGIRCILSANNDASITSAWWRVDLGQKTLIREVIVYFRTNYKPRRNGILIYIADTAASQTDGANCYTVTGNRNGTDIPNVLTATCSGEGRYLVLYTTTVNNPSLYQIPIMDFCEVEVNVCGPCTFGTNCSNYCHCDGKSCNSVNGVCPNGVCLPGWKMDKCDTACDDGSYGTNCTQTCLNRNCKSYSSSCNHVTGKCLGGCKAGWAGTDCTQACIQGLEYSAGCGGNCSACMCKGGKGTCPRDTGRCDSGCQSGWKGEDCSTVCSLGTYGANCTEKCGQCSDSKTCHHVNGACSSGCIDGWTCHHCKQAIIILLVNNASAIAGSIVAVLAVVAIVRG